MQNLDSNSATAHKVLVLLATFNGDQYVKDQITSILEQKGVECKIWISDDCSTDDTVTLIREAFNNDQRVKLVSENIKYGSSAKNFLALTRLLATKGFDGCDYVAYSDQDDLWSSEKILHGINCLNKTGCAGYSSSFIAFWKDGRERAVNKALPQTTYDYVFEGPGPGCSFVMTKKIMSHFSDFLCKSDQNRIDAIAYHDWFLYVFARVNGYYWFIDSCSKHLRYRQHNNNVLGVNVGLMALVMRLRTLKSGHFGEQIRNNLLAVNDKSKILSIITDSSLKGRIVNAFLAFSYRRAFFHKIMIACIFLFGGLFE